MTEKNRTFVRSGYLWGLQKRCPSHHYEQLMGHIDSIALEIIFSPKKIVYTYLVNVDVS